MKRRASLKDVAEKAGVSIATVDRVLNARGRVKEVTAQLVRSVAEDLGYEDRVYDGDFVFNVLLHDPDHLYYRDLGQAILSEAERLGRDGLKVNIHYLLDTEDRAVAARIDELAADADGIAGVFVQNRFVLESLSRVIETGKPLVTLLTDIRHPRRFAYVGLDNRTTGRTAGYILGRLIRRSSGLILVTTETMNFLGLEEREMGLRSVLMERFPHLQMSSVIETGISRDTMVQRVAERVADPEVVGVYNVGGRNSVIAEAIRASGRSPGDVVFVGSELTDVSRKLLIEGRMDATISFPAWQAGRAVAEALLAAAGRSSALPRPTYEPFHIHFVENAIG